MNHERNEPNPDIMSDSGGKGRMEGGSDNEGVNSDTRREQQNEIIGTMKRTNEKAINTIITKKKRKRL